MRRLSYTFTVFYKIAIDPIGRIDALRQVRR